MPTTVKFTYSEKATKFCKISTVDLTVTKAKFAEEGTFFMNRFPSLRT